MATSTPTAIRALLDSGMNSDVPLFGMSRVADSDIDPSLRGSPSQESAGEADDYVLMGNATNAGHPNALNQPVQRRTTGGKQPRTWNSTTETPRAGASSNNDDDEFEEINMSDVGSDSDDDSRMPSIEDQQIGQRLAKQTARKLNLSDAYTQKAMRYAKLRKIEQSIELYCHVLDLVKKGNEIEDTWTPNSDVTNNLKEICKAVMMSPNIPSYKGNAVGSIVIVIIGKRDVGLSPGTLCIPSKLRTIQKIISNVTTNFRSDMKKCIVRHTTDKNNGPANIDVLTNALYKKSAMNLQQSVESWGRIALMRAVLMDGGDSTKFWDILDNTIASVRNTAQTKYPGVDEGAERNMCISNQIKMVLKTDYKLYGNPMDKANMTEPPERHLLHTDDFQDIVDETAGRPLSEISELAMQAMGKGKKVSLAGRKRQRFV